MKIAIPFENGQVGQHFGQCAQFKLYSVTDGKLTSYEVVDISASGHSERTTFLLSHGVTTLLCGGIGEDAVKALTAAGIQIFGGLSGSCDLTVSDLLAGRLTPGVDGPQGGHCKGGHGGAGGHCAHHDYVNNRHTCHGENDGE